MRHKRFVYRCPLCEQTGLQPDPGAVYKVRVCDTCEGSGKVRMTVMQWIEVDYKLRGGESWQRYVLIRVRIVAAKTTFTARASAT